MTSILGISAFYHDSAAALVRDGEVVAAAQEERFTRKKHDAAFPRHAIDYCLAEAGLRPEQLDFVGFYDKPLLKFDRLIETYLAFVPAGYRSFVRAMPKWLKQNLHLPREMRRGLGGAYRKRFVFAEHHESHAASAFFPSPFEEAAILTLDGVGEWATASVGVGRGNRIELLHQLRFPHSLGLLYSAFTYYCGFEVNSGEYKLMGLAPFGEPVHVDTILENLMDLKDDGSFRLDLSYFNYCQGLTMTSAKFHRLFGGPPRRPDSPIDRRFMDIAASIQKVTEQVMLRAARFAHHETGVKNLCMAGGVALNCVGNGRILREGPFDDIWIQPASGDAGGALGVAQLIWYQLLDNPREAGSGDRQRGSMLGPSFDDARIREMLDRVGVRYRHFADESALCDHVAVALADGKVVGWHQGRMEFGPRALGARSILADARDERMQSVINMKVKFREGFRPFAPVVLRENAADWFELDAAHESPYMLLVAPVRHERRVPVTGEPLEGIDKLQAKRSVVPAITHVDHSARIQTVDRVRHGRLRALMEAFHAKTGCPVMVNTSFNLGWDPIVRTPEEAYRTFMASGLDVLCVGGFVVHKGDQRVAERDARADRHGDANSDAGSDAGSVGGARARAGRRDPVLDDLVQSPCCAAGLRRRDGALACAQCGHAFARDDDGDVPLLFWPHDTHGLVGDVTERVKEFYEDTPFPDYDDHDSVRSLIEKSRRGGYARCLDGSIPYDSRVLEVGCGTGQLTNFLGISFRRVVGTDMCLHSLRLGERFRRQHGLSRVRFVQMNLFRPALRPGQFDVVLCNGVLHHTSDPFGGFRNLVPLVKPGGHIVIGLYNRYGRLSTNLRQLLFKLTGGRGQWIEPMLRRLARSETKRRAWFADQYRHPHESKHTVGEVLRWFDECGVEFVRGVPSVTPVHDPLGDTDLFEPRPRGTRLDHALSQLGQIVTGSREGGLFLMIGRRRAAAPTEPAAPAAPPTRAAPDFVDTLPR